MALDRKNSKIPKPSAGATRNSVRNNSAVKAGRQVLQYAVNTAQHGTEEAFRHGVFTGDAAVGLRQFQKYVKPWMDIGIAASRIGASAAYRTRINQHMASRGAAISDALDKSGIKFVDKNGNPMSWSESCKGKRQAAQVTKDIKALKKTGILKAMKKAGGQEAWAAKNLEKLAKLSKKASKQQKKGIKGFKSIPKALVRPLMDEVYKTDFGVAYSYYKTAKQIMKPAAKATFKLGKNVAKKTASVAKEPAKKAVKKAAQKLASPETRKAAANTAASAARAAKKAAKATYTYAPVIAAAAVRTAKNIDIYDIAAKARIRSRETAQTAKQAAQAAAGKAKETAQAAKGAAKETANQTAKLARSAAVCAKKAAIAKVDAARTTAVKAGLAIGTNAAALSYKAGVLRESAKKTAQSAVKVAKWAAKNPEVVRDAAKRAARSAATAGKLLTFKAAKAMGKTAKKAIASGRKLAVSAAKKAAKAVTKAIVDKIDNTAINLMLDATHAVKTARKVAGTAKKTARAAINAYKKSRTAIQHAACTAARAAQTAQRGIAVTASFMRNVGAPAAKAAAKAAAKESAKAAAKGSRTAANLTKKASSTAKLLAGNLSSKTTSVAQLLGESYRSMATKSTKTVSNAAKKAKTTAKEAGKAAQKAAGKTAAEAGKAAKKTADTAKKAGKATQQTVTAVKKNVKKVEEAAKRFVSIVGKVCTAVASGSGGCLSVIVTMLACIMIIGTVLIGLVSSIFSFIGSDDIMEDLSVSSVIEDYLVELHEQEIEKINQLYDEYDVREIIFPNGTTENYKELISALTVYTANDTDGYPEEVLSNYAEEIYDATHTIEISEFTYTDETDGDKEKTGVRIYVYILRDDSFCYELLESSGTSSYVEGDWMAIVRSMKQTLANAVVSQGLGYSQSGYIDITFNGTTYNVRRDCSGFVSACLQAYGSFSKGTVWYSGLFTYANSGSIPGFTKLTWAQAGGWDGLQTGDIISYRDDVNGVGHVEIFAYNRGGIHYVYSCGSTKSLQSTGVTTDNRYSYMTVWRPLDAGSSVSGDDSEGDTETDDSDSYLLMSNTGEVTYDIYGNEEGYRSALNETIDKLKESFNFSYSAGTHVLETQSGYDENWTSDEGLSSKGSLSASSVDVARLIYSMHGVTLGPTALSIMDRWTETSEDDVRAGDLLLYYEGTPDEDEDGNPIYEEDKIMVLICTGKNDNGKMNFAGLAISKDMRSDGIQDFYDSASIIDVEMGKYKSAMGSGEVIGYYHIRGILCDAVYGRSEWFGGWTDDNILLYNSYRNSGLWEEDVDSFDDVG